MQKFTEESLEAIDKLLERLGKKALFIPVGISGSYNVLDPDTKRPPFPAIAALYHLADPKLAWIKIGLPLKSDQLPHFESGEEFNRYLAEKVALLLPYNERGIYKKQQKPREATIIFPG